jgi:hypothetical protein
MSRKAAAPAKAKQTATNRRQSTAESRKASLLSRSGIEPARTAGRPLVAASKGRKNKRSMAIYMDQMVKDELDAIALRERRSIQDLGLEAINLLLVRYGSRAIA